jgi:hypothetical protein
MQKSLAALFNALMESVGRRFALYSLCFIGLGIGAFASRPAEASIVGAPQPPTVVMNMPTTTFYAGSAFTLASLPEPGTGSNSTASVTGVTYYVNGTAVGTATSSPWSLAWNIATPGTYSVNAVVSSTNQLTGTSATITITIIPVQPTITLATPANGASYNAPASLPLTVSVTGGTYAISSVNYYNGSTLLGTGSSSLGWSYTPPSQYAGSYVISAKVTTAGGTTATSNTNTVTVVTVLPTVAVTSPTNSATYTSPATETFTASASGGSYPVTSVSYYNGSTLLGTINGATSPWTFTATLAPGC